VSADLFTDAQLQAVETGDLATLCELDERGFLLGDAETTADFAERLRCLQRNIVDMQKALEKDGTYDVAGFDLRANDRIPAERFGPIHPLTRELYGFAIDWVPGFYIDPSFSWLFGGCAFYFFPDFFALFIIRKTFADRNRWLIYSRDELLAHEQCHVARIALNSAVFEETMAYQTSTSTFRRAIGGLFRKPTDSFMLLGSTMILLAGQLLRVLMGLPIPIVLLWCVVAGVVAFLAARHWRYDSLHRRALANLCEQWPDTGRCILFRCTARIAGTNGR